MTRAALLLAKPLGELGYMDFELRIVKDEIVEIQAAILDLCESCHAVFTTGGTGFAPRDVTPEATAPLLEKRADSLCELMRLKGMGQTNFSHLSRGVAGVCKGALVVNLPGSPKAVLQGIRAIGQLIEPIPIEPSRQSLPRKLMLIDTHCHLNFSRQVPRPSGGQSPKRSRPRESGDSLRSGATRSPARPPSDWPTNSTLCTLWSVGTRRTSKT